MFARKKQKNRRSRKNKIFFLREENIKTSTYGTYHWKIHLSSPPNEIKYLSFAPVLWDILLPIHLTHVT